MQWASSTSKAVVLHGTPQESGLLPHLTGRCCLERYQSHWHCAQVKTLQERVPLLERATCGTQVWYDNHIKVDSRDVEKELNAAAEKGEDLEHWHLPGMQRMHGFLQKLMNDGGRVGSRVHHKLKGDLRGNTFGAGKHVGPPSLCPLTAEAI